MVELTKNNTNMQMNVCFAYNSEFEVDQALKTFGMNQTGEGPQFGETDQVISKSGKL